MPSGAVKWVLAVLLVGSGLQLWHVSTGLTVASCGPLALVALVVGSAAWQRQRSMTGRAPEQP